jgi:diguanylate cyclase (GGDEF)-like protein
VTVTPARKRLLVVDDEPVNCDLMTRIFESEYEVHTAADGEQGLELARRLRPDVVITDQRMPVMSGVDFLTHLKEELPHTIRVLLTGYSDYASLLDAVNVARIHHYVEKPFHTVDLRTVVRALVRSAELEMEREQRESQLEHLVQARTAELVEANRQLAAANQRLQEVAIRDGLTGLFNHSYLLEHLQIEVARSARYRRSFSLLFADVDDFKVVNDRFGHPTGDAVLKAMARLFLPLSIGTRGSDVAARYGGEEFCVVLTETLVDGACTKAERIRAAVEAIDWKAVDPRLVHPVTVSIGVATYPDHAKSVDALIEAADQALYAAKAAGKNRVVIAAAPR